MDQHYRDASHQGYYGAERESEDRKRQQQLLLQQQQHLQHVPHYPHQLGYHPALLSAAQQVPFILSQSDQLRNRGDYSSSEQPSQALLQSSFQGTGPVAGGSSIPLHTSSEQTLSFAPRDPHHQPPHLQQPSSQAPTFPHHISVSRSGQTATTTIVELSQSSQSNSQNAGANVMEQMSRGPQSTLSSADNPQTNSSQKTSACYPMHPIPQKDAFVRDSRTSPENVTHDNVLPQHVPLVQNETPVQKDVLVQKDALSHKDAINQKRVLLQKSIEAGTLVNLTDFQTSPQNVTCANVPSGQSVQHLSKKHVLTESGLSHLNSSLHPALLPKKKTSKSKNSKSRRKTKPEDELPEFLAFRYEAGDKENIRGVEAKRTAEEGTVFGPYDGNLVDEAGGARKESTWELCLRGKVFLYVDGKRKGSPNMMSFIRCARTAAEQNLEAFQTLGDIYFRVTKDIAPGTELRVFYSEAYRELVGFKLGLNDLNYDEETDSFQCTKCKRKFSSAKAAVRHHKIDHETNGVNELCPVVTWKLRGSKSENTKLRKAEKTEKIRTENARVVKAELDKCISEKIDGKNDMAGDSEEEELGDQDSPKWHFVCTVCGKAFPSEGRLEAHAMFHETSQEQVCPVCGVRQKNAHALTKHMDEHSVRANTCARCGKEFKKRSNLYRHERVIHGISVERKRFTCKFCGSKFAKKRECSNHEKTHSEFEDNVKHEDENVEKQTGEKGASEEINTNVHAVVNASILADEENTNEMKDKVQDKVTKKSTGSRITAPRKPRRQIEPPPPPEHRDMLGKSADYYIKPKPFKCRYCPKRYADKPRVMTHEKEKHEGTGTFKCTDCTRVFVNKTRFINHLKDHERNWLYRCSLCSRSFASESALNNHQGEHTGLKPFKCDVCGRGFRVKKAVYQHKTRMHRTRPMRFFCPVCNKGFPDRGGLKKHEYRHKGIRPFVCLTCGKGFTVKHSLQIHVRNAHGETKPFTCPICQKTFSVNHSFTGHMFRHQLKGEGVEQAGTSVVQQQGESDPSGLQAM